LVFDKTTKYISISKENVDIFLKYLKFELNSYTDNDVSLSHMLQELPFCRSDTGEEALFQTFQFV
jgi:hypothetical protein